MSIGFAALCFLHLQCSQHGPELHRITGKAAGYGRQTASLILLEDNGGKRLLLDTAKMDDSGQFILEAAMPDNAYLQLKLSAGPEILLVNDSRTMTVKLDKQQPWVYSVQGSVASAEIADFNSALRQAIQQRDLRQQQWIAALAQKLPDSVLTPIRLQWQRDSMQFYTVLNQSAGSMTTIPAARYALGVVSYYLPYEPMLALQQKLALSLNDSSLRFALTPPPPTDTLMPGRREELMDTLRNDSVNMP